jgi:hypothetical protein
MKVATLSALSSLILALFLSSCGKHNDGSPVVDPPAPGTININLATNPVVAGSLEVIIAESSGGKVLLDTTGPITNSLVASLHTDQKLLDYSLIIYNSYSTQYQVTTYKAVDLSNWTALNQSDYSAPISQLPSRQASLVYTNIPLNQPNIYMNDYVGANGFSQISTPPNSYGFTYTQYGSNNYMYLLFSGTGLYNFHIPRGLADTVDLSHIDTAVTLNFNVPVGYTVTGSQLIGIMDTTDFGRSVILYDNTIFPGQPDMEYPRKLVQKYEPYIYANNGNGKNYFVYYGYGDSIPSTLPIPNLSQAYTISSSLSTNFSVKFGSASPSAYSSTWNSTGVRWTLYCSPDSTTLNPAVLLTSLNSKMLKGQNLSGLAAAAFGYESAQGFKYQDFFSYVHNPALIKTRRVPVSIKFGQTF